MDEGDRVYPGNESAALVVIEFPSFRDFIDAYSPIISEEGIFIRNADVSESNAFSVGDRVDFEVRLKDDFRLIQGAGEVAWLGESDAADGASGTAIRFHDVDEPSQRLISRLVGNYVRDGGTLFQLDEGKPGSDLVVDSELLESPLVGGLDSGSELTAESLGASEADALFADSEEEGLGSAPLEFESVALDDVEVPKVPAPADEAKAEDSPEVADAGSERSVGLETIAIPSGLVASMASEAREEADLPALDVDDLESAAQEAQPAVEPGEAPAVDGRGAQISAEPTDGADGPGAAEALASAAPAAEDREYGLAEPDHPAVLLAGDLGEDSLKAAADSLETDLAGQGGIPDDIAQVAEELSGVHRYDPPALEDASASAYAGSASVGSDRNVGGLIAVLVVAFVLLGAGAFYFGDDVLSMLGLGGATDVPAKVDLVREGEAMPAPAAAASGSEDTVSDSAGQSDTSSPASPAESAQSAQRAGEAGIAEDLGSTAAAKPEPESASLGVAEVEGETARAQADSRSSAATTGGADNAESAAAPVSVRAARASERRVEAVSWREAGGSTIVTIRLDAEISKAYLEVVRVRNGAPREVIKIQGVNAPYSPAEMAVGTSHLLRLRTGLHRGSDGSALHVVADLTSAAVSVRSIEPQGRNLTIVFSGDG